MRRAAAAFAAYGLAPLLLLVGLEGVVRLTAPHDFSLRTFDARLLDFRDGPVPYVNRPGFRGEIWSRPVTIDARGLRGGTDADDDRLRLLLLGDSVLFGIGLADDEAPAAVLPTLLDTAVAVLNAATIGYATIHEAAYLDAFGPALRPDVVVLGFCVNDAVTAPLALLPEEAAETLGVPDRLNLWLLRHSLLYLRLKDTFKSYRLRHGYTATYRPRYTDAAWQPTREALLRIAAWARDRGLPLVVLAFPHRDQLLGGADFLPQQRLRALSHEAGFRLIDLRETLTPGDYLAADPVHLDRHGMRKALTALAAACGATLAHCRPHHPAPDPTSEI